MTTPQLWLLADLGAAIGSLMLGLTERRVPGLRPICFVVALGLAGFAVSEAIALAFA